MTEKIQPSKNKIISTALVFLLGLALFPQPSRAATTDAILSLNPSSTSVAVGADFNLVAHIDPGSNTTTGDYVNGVQLDVHFDPAVLQLTSVTASGIFSIAMPSSLCTGTPTSCSLSGDTGQAYLIDNTNGYLSVALWTGSGHISAASDVATLAFHAQAAGNNSSVTLVSPSANASVNDGSGTLVVGTRNNATVTVTGSSPTTYTIGGTISGLSGTVVLQNNGGDNLTRSADGGFTFGTAINDGSDYDVTVLTQPNGQNCSVANGSDTVSGANVTNVAVTCVDDTGPSRTGGAPSGTLAAGTTGTTLSLTTGVDANCKFGTVPNTDYASIANTFTTTGSTSHSFALTGLTNGTTYRYYVRCSDLSDNVNISDYAITFSVASPTSSSGSNSSHRAKKKVTVRHLYVSASSIRRGQLLIESGKGFSRNSNVALYFSRSDGTYYPPRIVRTTSTGSFSVSYLVPSAKPIGQYRWYAVNLKTGWKSKTKAYTVK